jgi:hypothetical protein
MPLQHLLKQMETYNARRSQRDVRPAWVTEFINSVAELFEPLDDVGRVGFDCQITEDRWDVGMYLGSTEIVGGKHDGRDRHTAFEFDLLTLQHLFEQVYAFDWTAFPSDLDGHKSPARCVVTVDGLVGANPLRLRILSVPPDDAGPGFREYPGGRCEPA